MRASFGMKYSFFTTIRKYTFYRIDCQWPSALNMLKMFFFLIPLTTCILPVVSKRTFEIPPFLNPQFSGGNTGTLRVIFLHTNVALELQNWWQFVWPKTLHRPLTIKSVPQMLCHCILHRKRFNTPNQISGARKAVQLYCALGKVLHP